MQRITIEDNSCGRDALTERQLAALSVYAGVPLQELQVKARQLLIFPHCLGGNRDGIERQTLFEIAGGRLKTGNVLGFFCIDDMQIAIHSRFDRSDRQFFLHHMLRKVFGIHILNLENHMGTDELWEFLIYLFPHCLLRALKQGIFRAYRQYESNDARAKGAVDIARQLKTNVPFNGKIACRVREYSADNPLTQLIRHTIEFIRDDRRRAVILRGNTEIEDAVSQIAAVTPSYDPRERARIVFRNLRAANHPFFTEYTFLRELCLRILRRDRISTGYEDRKIRGIIFDGAWLWEEYLATMLKPYGFEHPENKTGRGRRYLFTDNSGWIYPDFIGGDAVLDAKYKPLDTNNISREDRFQIISYMHVLQKGFGYLLFPSRGISPAAAAPRTLNGFGGKLGTVALRIPQSEDRDDFRASMELSERLFCETVGGIAGGADGRRAEA